MTAPLTLTDAADAVEAILARRLVPEELRLAAAGRAARARTWSTVDGLRYLGTIASDLAGELGRSNAAAANDLLALRLQIAERLAEITRS